MTFGHPWVLLFACLPALWVYWEWRDSARRIALLLKAAGLAAVLVALSEPRITIYETKVAAAILVDTSASVTEQDLARASDLVPRLVLISDGNENLGSVVRAAWQSRQLGIPIDTYSLGGHPKPNLRLESM